MAGALTQLEKTLQDLHLKSTKYPRKKIKKTLESAIKLVKQTKTKRQHQEELGELVCSKCNI